jgi:hypothetical protein
MSKRREINKLIQYKKKAKNFILPMLGIPISQYEPYIIDCNIIVEGFPKIVVIFDNVDDEPLKMLIYRLQSEYLFLDCEYDDDDREAVLFFDVPKEFKGDFELFIKGSYSKFSDVYKNRLIKYFGKVTCEDWGLVTMWDTIHPREHKRNQIAEKYGVEADQIIELISSPDLEHEIYKTIEELKEIYDKAGQDRHSVEEI